MDFSFTTEEKAFGNFIFGRNHPAGVIPMYVSGCSAVLYSIPNPRCAQANY